MKNYRIISGMESKTRGWLSKRWNRLPYLVEPPNVSGEKKVDEETPLDFQEDKNEKVKSTTEKNTDDRRRNSSSARLF